MGLSPDEFKQTCESVGGTLKQVDEKTYACEVPLKKGSLVINWKNGFMYYIVNDNKEISAIFKTLTKFFRD